MVRKLSTHTASGHLAICDFEVSGQARLRRDCSRISSKHIQTAEPSAKGGFSVLQRKLTTLMQTPGPKYRGKSQNGKHYFCSLRSNYPRVIRLTEETQRACQ